MNFCIHWPSCANRAPIMVYLLKMNSSVSSEHPLPPSAPRSLSPSPPLPRMTSASVVSASASFYMAAMGPGGGGGTTATRSDRAPAVSGAQKVGGVGKGEVTSNAAGRGQVVLGVAPPPSGTRVGDAPAVSGARRVVVGGKGKGKGAAARPGQMVLGVAPYPPPPPPPGVRWSFIL